MYWLNLLASYLFFFLSIFSFIYFFHFSFGISSKPRLIPFQIPLVFATIILFLLSFFLFITFMNKATDLKVSQQVLSGQTIKECGIFLGMREGGVVIRGSNLPYNYWVFMIKNRERNFKNMSSAHKDFLMSLQKGDDVCLNYVLPPPPQADVIMINISKN